MIEGVPKSAKDNTNAKSTPALTAGKTNGKVTLMNFVKGLHPKLSAASSSETLIVLKAPEVNKKTKG